MLRVGQRRRRSVGSGIVWPDSGNATTSNVGDVFGPRPFSFHITTVGYDYDFHRGCDFPLSAGDPLYSPINGSVIRWHYTSFGFEESSHLTQFSETDSQSAASFAHSGTSCVISGSRVGALTWPTQAAFLSPATNERIVLTGDDWEVRVKFTSAPSVSGGAVGCGVYDSTNNEWAAIEYDGTTITCRGRDSGGNMVANGTTSAQASKTWIRIAFTQATGTLAWSHSTDGNTWTDVVTETTITWTDATRPRVLPILYWLSKDTNAAVQTANVDFFGWVDTQTIGRFGNWVEISNASQKFCMMHLQTLSIARGDVLEAGQLVGYAGMTGFDSRSGTIISPHVHLEVCSNNNYLYNNDEPINPLGVGILPRDNTTSNVSVVRDSANDPDGVDSHRLTITVTRSDQNFDLNEISLTGNTTSRTVNWNTRSGLNADNDVPKQSGVYIVPEDFNSSSASYVVAIYFNKTVVGNTFASAYCKDTAGTTVWSG